MELVETRMYVTALRYVLAWWVLGSEDIRVFMALLYGGRNGKLLRYCLAMDGLLVLP